MTSTESEIAALHFFTARSLDRERLTTALEDAGFNASLGFGAIFWHDAPAHSDYGVDISEGSVVVLDETSFGQTHRLLQKRARNLPSLYLVVLTDANEILAPDRAKAIRDGLPPTYQEVVILPSTSNEKNIASEAAALVERHRMDPNGVLLWIIDDDASRFDRGGCWAKLAATAQSSVTPTGRVRIVRSLVREESLSGAASRTKLVSDWRQRILEPARTRGTHLVLIADNQFSERDTHLGEAWAATVAQRLAGTHVFVASVFEINLVRPKGVQGIWIGSNQQLAADDVTRILTALSAPHPPISQPIRECLPAKWLSFDRARTIALSSTTFKAIWSGLLSLSDLAVLISLHHCLMASGHLDDMQRRSVWTALDWNDDLAAALASDPETSLSDWISVLPPDRRQAAAAAWQALLGSHEGNSITADPPIQLLTPIRLSFLAVIDEWASHHGGLSTFNRAFCLALARAGHYVECLLLNATEDEIAQARAQRVLLIRAEVRLGDHPYIGLYLPARVGNKPDFVIGHGRISGPAARAQVVNYFPESRRVHFFHMAPEEIEPSKAGAIQAVTRDAAKLADERMKIELDLARSAALVVAVGPRLHRELTTQLVRPRPTTLVHRLDPGFAAFTEEERSPPPAIFCLLFGRVEDYDLKGLDLAARAVGSLSQGASARYDAEISLVVRGVPPGQWKECRDALQKDGGPTLQVRVRNFSVDPEDSPPTYCRRA